MGAYKHQDKRTQWIEEIKQRPGKNICNVTIANKNARIARALLTNKQDYCVIGA